MIQSPAGYELAGQIDWPEHHDGDVPVAILVSGSGAQDRDADMMRGGYSAHRQWREILNNIGFAVVTFDETGTGASGGDWSEMGLAEHRDNALAALNYAEAAVGAQPPNTYAFGHSEGSMIVSMMSAQDPSIDGIVHLAGPGVSAREAIEYQIEGIAQNDRQDGETHEEAKERLRNGFMARMANVQSFQDGFEIDPLEIARRINAPALILQGAADTQVLPEQAQALAQATAGSGQTVEVYVYPDVNHLMVNDPTHSRDYRALEDLTLDDRVVTQVTEWLLAVEAR